MTNKQHNAIQKIATKYQHGQDVTARDVFEMREALGDKHEKVQELFVRFMAHEPAWRALRRAALIAFTTARFELTPRGLITPAKKVGKAVGK